MRHFWPVPDVSIGDDFLEKVGKQTIKFNNPPTIVDCASIVGPKESQGPLAKYFDQTLDDEFIIVAHRCCCDVH